MADRPVLFVTGLGRCGTTMVMHMLRAAGVTCAGSGPAFEDIPVTPGHVDHDWLARQGGRAVKWIDPTVTHVRHKNAAAIFLTRDREEQARSQAKLMGVRLSRDDRRRMKALIDRDTDRARRIVTSLLGVHHVLHLRFENVIKWPLFSAEKIALFCDGHDIDFGSEKDAASVVRARDPACAPDIAIEAALMRAEVAQ